MNNTLKINKTCDKFTYALLTMSTSNVYDELWKYLHDEDMNSAISEIRSFHFNTRNSFELK